MNFYEMVSQDSNQLSWSWLWDIIEKEESESMFYRLICNYWESRYYTQHDYSTKKFLLVQND
jgi:hypothetical protein